MLNEQQFDRKWGEIKGGLRNLWGRLTDDELDMVKGNIYEVTGLVQSKYGESKDEIRHKLDQLVESFDNDTDKDIDPDVSSYMRSPVMDDADDVRGSIDQTPHSPNRPRTSEASQLEDADFGIRNPETESFSKKTYEKAKDGLDDPRHHTNYSGANPGRSGFGPTSDQQDSTLKDKQDFDSDRNARH